MRGTQRECNRLRRHDELQRGDGRDQCVNVTRVEVACVLVLAVDEQRGDSELVRCRESPAKRVEQERRAHTLPLYSAVNREPGQEHAWD